MSEQSSLKKLIDNKLINQVRAELSKPISTFSFISIVKVEVEMDQLPDEILMQILKHLTTYELIQFCQATGKYYFLREKKFVSVINLAGQFEAYTLPLSRFLLRNISYECTETLNVSYLYWIKNRELKRLINRLGNLNELIAVDTNLELHELKRPIFMQLKKLAVTLKKDEVTRCPCMQNNLKSLYIQINEIPYHCLRKIEFMGNFINLEELWIANNEDEGQYLDYFSIAENLKNLKKLVIKASNFLPDFDLSYLGYYKVFERKSTSSSVLLFERLEKPNITRVTETMKYGIWKLWKKIKKSHKYLPCGIKECRQLFLDPDINNISFEDLNFAEDPFECRSHNLDSGINSQSIFASSQVKCKSRKYYKAVLKLLCSTNAKHLKRLALRSCNSLWISTLDKKISRKRTADGRPIVYNKIGDNIRSLKVLELLHCPDCNEDSDFLTDYMIDNFESLEKVTFPVEKESSGFFLKKMFLKCPHLYSLNIVCDNGSTSFIKHLCRFLQYATNLRDFRLDYKADNISNILKALGNISSKKLLRVVLKCKTLRDSYDELFTDFVKKNPQLIFLYLAVSDDFIDETMVLQETFDRLRNGNPSKIFLVKPVDTDFFLAAPAAHRDMLFSRTEVSVVKLEDF